MEYRKLEEIIAFNPSETLKKGTLCKKISMDKLDNFSKYIRNYELEEYNGGMKFKNGDTLLARITPCLENGKTSKVTILNKDEIGFGSTEYIVMRRKKGISDEDFIYYLAISPQFRNIAIKSMTGTSGRQRVQLDVVKNAEMLVPDYEEQVKIGKVLSCIDKKIELNNQTNENLQELINNLFMKYFIDYDKTKYETKESELGRIPIDWNVGKLSDIVEFSNGYGFDSKKMLDEKTINSYKVFKMGNINIGGGINKSKTKSWMKFEDCTGLDKFIAKKGDVLMCMTDMKNSGNPLLGHTALIDKDDEFIINQRVGLLRCNKGISYSYVYTLSNLEFFIEDIRSRANSGVQVNLTTKGICETKVIIPNRETLEKFDNVAKPIYEMKFNILKENEELIQLRDTLLPKLMNGEIYLDKI